MSLPMLGLLVVMGVAGLLSNAAGRLDPFLRDKDRGTSVIRQHAEELLLLREAWRHTGAACQHLSGYQTDEQFFLELQDAYAAGSRDGWLVPQDSVDYAVICRAFGEPAEQPMLSEAPEKDLLRSFVEEDALDETQRGQIAGLFKNRGPDWWTETLAALFDGREFLVAQSPLAAASTRKLQWRIISNSTLWLLTILGMPALFWTIWTLARHQPTSVPRLQAAWTASAVLGAWLLSEFLTEAASVVCALLITFAVSLFPDGTQVETSTGLQIIRTILTTVLEFIPVILLVWLLTPGRRAALRLLGLTRPSFSKFHLLVLSLGGMALAHATLQSLGPIESIFKLEDPTDRWSRDFAALGWLGIPMELVVGCLAAPFIEEVVFRGILFAGFRNRFGDFTAALLSSALFAAVHYYSFIGSLSVFLIGMVLCLLYDRGRTLWIPIIAHSLINLSVTLNS